MSTSLGGRGLTFNLSRRGMRQTVGLPGSGMSYSTYQAFGADGASGETAPPTGSDTGCGILAIGVVVVLAIALFMRSGSPRESDATPVPQAVAAAPEPQTLVVGARVLNCRREPAKSSPIVRKLAHGDRVVVVERSNGWVRSDAAGSCWVAESYLYTDRR